MYKQFKLHVKACLGICIEKPSICVSILEDNCYSIGHSST